MQIKEFHTVPEVDATFPCGSVGKTSTEGTLCFIVMNNKLIGKKLGKLTVIRPNGNKTKRGNMWDCLCECGNTVELSISDINRGKRKSCGCQLRETLLKRNTTHGKTGTRIYNIYLRMKQRCFDKNSSDFNFYGGRGITMCIEWKNDFMSFYNWAIKNGYTDKLTIERTDNNGNYEPFNCKWITRSQQSKNKRNNHFLTFNSKTQIIEDWSRETGIGNSLIRYRLRSGWPVEKVLNPNKYKYVHKD